MNQQQWDCINHFNLYPYSLDDGTVCAGTPSGNDYTFPANATPAEIAEVLKKMPEIREA